MSLTREWNKQIMDYIQALLNKPRKIVLGGTSGSGGGSGYPPGGITGQLPQRYVSYDTTEADTAGSTPSPSLVHNLNRIRGGWAIGDEAIRERHMLWATGVWGTSGCISAWDVPYYSTSGCIPAESTHQAIEWLYTHRGDDATSNFYTWHTFTFSIEGTLVDQVGSLRLAVPGDMTIDHAYLTSGSAPLGQSIIGDVNKNGTTIFTNQANRPEIEPGATAGTSGTPDITDLALNDYLTFDLDQRGSTSPGENLVAHVRCKQYLSED